MQQLIILFLLGISLILVWSFFVSLKRQKLPKRKFVRAISERRLFEIIKRKFKDAEYQKRFEWLGSQSFDIYIPSKKVAIEYQGIQHFKPVDIFGGKSQYKQQRYLDKSKIKKAKKNNVKLIYFTYDEKAPNKLYGKKVFKSEEELIKEIKGNFWNIIANFFS